MKESIKVKLLNLVERHEEISALLSEPDVINNQNKFRDLSKEYSDLESIVSTFKAYQKTLDNEKNALEMLEDESDPELKEMVQEELEQAQADKDHYEQALQVLLLPRDPDDDKNVFLEVRAGTGGDEAAIFAGDLFRAYSHYAELKRWHVEIVSSSSGEHGGFKEIIAKISGDSVYSNLKFESGAHRVQRVPATESQGRIHTSACTVAILPEVESVESIDINPADLRVDTYRASGAGGQHVNKTDSAVRITHLPTGIVVECQDERSQHKNRAKAMSLLQAKMLRAEREKQQKVQTETRRNLVGSGDRSDRIRTYNFPQGRVTDHRINLTLYKLDEIMAGQLDDLIQPLRTEHQADQLALIGESSEQH